MADLCPESGSERQVLVFDAGEFTGPLFGWAQARRFVVVRERERETKAAVGRRLLDVPGYTFRVWVTNRSQSAVELRRDYNGRAGIEPRIEELKHDLTTAGFCRQPFFATEAAFLAVLCIFNLLSLLPAPDRAGRAVSASRGRCAWRCSCAARGWASRGAMWW